MCSVVFSQLLWYLCFVSSCIDLALVSQLFENWKLIVKYPLVLLETGPRFNLSDNFLDIDIINIRLKQLQNLLCVNIKLILTKIIKSFYYL